MGGYSRSEVGSNAGGEAYASENISTTTVEVASSCFPANTGNTGIAKKKRIRTVNPGMRQLLPLFCEFIPMPSFNNGSGLPALDGVRSKYIIQAFSRESWFHYLCNGVAKLMPITVFYL